MERLVRGMNSWPSAYTYLNGKTLKVWEASVEESASKAAVGEVVEVTKDSIKVQTGKDLLVLKQIQLEGKKRMETAAFLRGFTVEDQTVFGL